MFSRARKEGRIKEGTRATLSQLVTRDQSPQLDAAGIKRFFLPSAAPVAVGRRSIYPPSPSLYPHSGIGEMYPPFPIRELNEVVIIYPKRILDCKRLARGL